MPYKVTAVPAVEPLSLAEAKAHLRVMHSEDDALITALIRSAREYAEKYTRRAFITQTIEYKTDAFADSMPLPLPPLQSVASVQYIDENGAQQTLDTAVYNVDSDSTPGSINLNDGQTWPATKDIKNAVTITLNAGYGADSTAVPTSLIQAMRLYLSKHYDMDRNESEYLNNGIYSNLDMEKIWSF